MARIDKYDPVSGGFRAPLNANMAKTEPGNPIGVGLNASGRVVAGAGATGIVGLLDLHSAFKAGQVVDVMTDGEFVEFAGTAGTVYTADTTTGVLGTTAADATHTRVGHTVEADRLVARVRR